jgi:outer membrane protein TolC
MSAPIDLIQILTGQMTILSRDRASANLASYKIMRFQAIFTLFALGLTGVGTAKAATAKEIELSGNNHRESKLIAKTPVAQTTPAKPVTTPASTTPTTPTTPPAPAAPTITPSTTTTVDTPNPGNSRGQIKNNLNIPRTGSEVQIGTNRALTLQDAVNIAFQNNRDVQSARLTVNRSQAAVQEAQAARAVQVGLTGTLANQGNPLIVGTSVPGVDTTSTDIQGRVQATYNLLNAGRDVSNIRAAEQQVNFDRLDLLRVEQLTRNNVVTAYYDLQSADSLVTINQASVRDATRSLSDAQLQERAGVGTRFDILRAQVQLATANQDLTNSQGQQRISRRRLAQLLSVDQNTEFTAADPVRELGTWGLSLEDSVVLAFKNRPEIKQQLVRRTIGEQQQIVVASGDAAQVSLFANYNIGKSISTSASAQDSYSLGAQLSWNFFDGGAALARSNQQQINQEIFENQFTSTRNQVRFEVEQAFNNLGTNQRNIITSSQALRQAEESLKLARLRFQAGVGTQTDVIQAQTELARARGNRIAAIVNYNRSLSSLRIATITGN